MTRARWGWAVLACALGCASARLPETRSKHVGAPLVLTAPDLDGADVDVGAADGKVHVVDFWATWCEPCKQAMPLLDAMARELGGRGLEVFGVSVDEDRSKVVEFLSTRPVTFRVLWDRGAERLVRLGLEEMPVTFLVDRRGVVRYVYQGWDASRARRERRQVEALLAEP